MADVKFDIALKNAGATTQGITVFSPVDLAAQKSNLYSLATPYKASYAANSLFVVSLSSGTINYTSPNYEITPTDLAVALTEAGAGEWSVKYSDAINGNVFYIATSAELFTLDISGIAVWATKYTIGNNLDKIQFASDSVVYAFSNFFPTLLKSTDSGETWQVVTLPDYSALGTVYGAMFFIDENTGWVAYGSVTGFAVHKTINGGASWTAQTTPALTNLYANAIFFADANNGWIGIDPIGLNYQLYTNDGGATWSSDTAGGNTRRINCLYFVDANTGWAAGYNGLIRMTINGGVTWLNQTSAVISITYDIYFIDASNGWLVGETSSGNTKVMKTTNGGVSWTNVLTFPSVSGQCYGVYFSDVNNGWVVGSPNAKMYKTTDGGNTWEDISSELPASVIPSTYLYSIAFNSSGIGIVCGDTLIIKYSA